MIRVNERLQLQNVISKSYTLGKTVTMETVWKEFVGYTMSISKGYRELPFYSVLSAKSANQIKIMMFVSVVGLEENVRDDYTFRSYLEIPEALAVRLFDNFEEKSIPKTYELEDFMKEHELVQTTPLFYFPIQKKDFAYVDIMVGYKTKD